MKLKEEQSAVNDAMKSAAACLKVEAVVLGGLLDPCGNIGTEGRFWLLPVPWEKEHFVAEVTNLIRFEFAQKARIEYQQIGFPEDPDDELALARGVGVRVWLVSGIDAQPLLETLRTEQSGSWPPKCWQTVVQLVDQLENVPSLDHKWSSQDPHAESSIDEIERFIRGEIQKFLVSHCATEFSTRDGS